MTVGDAHTGEVLDALKPDLLLTASEARDLTDRIRQTLTVAHRLIVEAFRGRAWVALGYGSWDAYCAGEFAEARMVRLDRQQRRAIVAEMRDAGMSTRAIGAGLGVDHKTVVNDAHAGGESSPPAPQPVTSGPQPVTGSDGKQYPRGKAKTMPTTTPRDAARVAKARELAAENCTTREIASVLEMTRGGCAKMLRREGIEVPADAIYGRTRPRPYRPDPAKAVADLLMHLDLAVLAAKFIEPAGLDPAHVEATESIAKSLRTLTLVNRRLRENIP